MTPSASALLLDWLGRQLDTAAWDWLAARRATLADAYTDRALHVTLGMIPRKLGKDDLVLAAGDIDDAGRVRAGFDPRRWSVVDAARVAVLLETADSGGEPFPRRFEDLCRNADVGELISLYRGLPLYPQPQTLEAQAAEGLRTNMRSVFEAVAHHSPYPREVFARDRWNQMVLKALFVGSALAPIQGLDERANGELAAILCDYAHERWAAGRAVSPELWRCVGPFAAGAMLDDLAKVLADADGGAREAAALALSASADPGAAALLATAPELAARAARDELSWDRVAPP